MLPLQLARLYLDKAMTIDKQYMQKVDIHEKILQGDNGDKGLKTRVAIAESTVAAHERRIEENTKKIEELTVEITQITVRMGFVTIIGASILTTILQWLLRDILAK